MRIGVDIRYLASGPWSGVEEYAHKILKTLLRVDRRNEYTFFVNGFREGRTFDGKVLGFSEEQLRRFRYPNKFLNLSFRFLRRPKLDRMAGDVDLFFTPHIIYGEVSSASKHVVTFHDLSFIRRPDLFSLRRRFWHLLVEPGRMARRADAIIAISESTKNDVVELFGVPEEKVRVVHSGLAKSFFEQVGSGDLAKVREKYGLPRKFILSLATVEPRKNLRTLVEAISLINKERKEKIKLVLAGWVGWLFKSDLKKYLNDDVILIGPVLSEERRALIRMARLVVYPSLYEGFGFPILEAMACRVPVVTSNVTSLPEVSGDAAMLVNPYDVSEIAGAIEKFWEGGALRERLIEKGLAQARKYTWERSARKTLKLFEEVGR